MTIEQLGEESIRQREQISSIKADVSELKEKFTIIESLTLSVQKLALSVEQIANNQAEDRASHKELIKEVSEIKNAPIKEKASTYDLVVKYILTAIVGAIVGYLINKFGL